MSVKSVPGESSLKAATTSLTIGSIVVSVVDTTLSLKLPLVSFVLVKYVNSAKVSIGDDLRLTPAATDNTCSAVLKLAIVALTCPGFLLITTSCKSKSIGSVYCQKNVS